MLVHSGKRVLERELTPHLAGYATKTLAEQGIELLLGERLVAASPQARCSRMAGASPPAR